MLSLLIDMEAEIVLPNAVVLINQRRFDMQQKGKFLDIYSNVRWNFEAAETSIFVSHYFGGVGMVDVAERLILMIVRKKRHACCPCT
jgi:hypothetical protein